MQLGVKVTQAWDPNAGTVQFNITKLVTKLFIWGSTLRNGEH